MLFSEMEVDKLPVPKLAWKRPEDIPFPNTWGRFQSRPRNGRSCNFKIVDLTPDRYEEAIKFMATYFLQDEPIRASVKILDDMNATLRYLHELKIAIEMKTTIVAVVDEDGAAPEIIAGIQVLYVATKGDPPIRHFNYGGENIRKLKRLADDLKTVDPFEVLGTDRLLQGFGLCVKPDFRGMNIGYHLLHSVENLAKAYGITGCMNIYSLIHSQALAEKVGFKVYNEVFYADYKDEKGKPLFNIKNTKSFKLMGIKYALE